MSSPTAKNTKVVRTFSRCCSTAKKDAWGTWVNCILAHSLYRTSCSAKPHHWWLQIRLARLHQCCQTTRGRHFATREEIHEKCAQLSQCVADVVGVGVSIEFLKSFFKVKLGMCKSLLVVVVLCLNECLCHCLYSAHNECKR